MISQLLAVSLLLTVPGRAAEPSTAPAVSAADALARLKDGNERFVEGKARERDNPARVSATSAKQTPFAAVLGCMDSRVGPELVFDQGIGDLFSLRVAGAVVDEDALGGLEYAAKVTGVRLIVVLGHTRCGAIQGACDDVKLGNLTALVSKIKPAVASVPANMTPRSSKNADFVEAVNRENVLLSVRQLTARSAILAELVKEGKLKIAGAIYDVATGKAEFLD